MPEIDIKKAYDKLKSKYSLPDFDVIDNYFEISCIEHEAFLLREIRRKISDKLEFCTNMLEALLQPDTGSISNMHEYRAFDDNKKKSIFNLYKELMSLHRFSLILECKLEGKSDAEFISDIFSKWSNIQKEMKKLFEDMKNSWTDETDVTEELGYFG